MCGLWNADCRAAGSGLGFIINKKKIGYRHTFFYEEGCCKRFLDPSCSYNIKDKINYRCIKKSEKIKTTKFERGRDRVGPLKKTLFLRLP